MRKSLFITIIGFAVGASLWAASPDDMAVAFAKKLIEKGAHPESGSLYALRFFQFTATTMENNPDSFVLSDKDAVKEAGLTESDRSGYVAALSDRSGARVKRLWTANRAMLYKLLSKERYKELGAEQVSALLEYRAGKKYAGQLAALKQKSPKPTPKTAAAAGEITEWDNYKELSFWYRRTMEGNAEEVRRILVEIQAHYAGPKPRPRRK